MEGINPCDSHTCSTVLTMSCDLCINSSASSVVPHFLLLLFRRGCSCEWACARAGRSVSTARLAATSARSLLCRRYSPCLSWPRRQEGSSAHIDSMSSSHGCALRMEATSCTCGGTALFRSVSSTMRTPPFALWQDTVELSLPQPQGVNKPQGAKLVLSAAHEMCCGWDTELMACIRRAFRRIAFMARH